MDRLNAEMHPHFNEDTIAALFEHEIFTVKDFVFSESHTLTKISTLLFKEVLEIKKEFTRTYSAVSENALDRYKFVVKNSAIIPSGISSLDKLLEGGLLTGHIYEFVGPANSGKTSIVYCFMRHLVFQLKQQCFFLDAKNDFSSIKLLSFCPNTTDADEIAAGLSRILIKKVRTKHELLNALNEIRERLDASLSLKLVIIDSLPAVMLDNNDKSENNSILTNLASWIRFIAVKHHVAVVTVNLLSEWVGVEGDFTLARSDAAEAVSCGKYWHTVPNMRIRMNMDRGCFRLGIEKSNILSESDMSLPFSDMFPSRNV